VTGTDVAGALLDFATAPDGEGAAVPDGEGATVAGGEDAAG